MSLGKSDPPPAPDYTGAAIATAQGNQDAARVAAKANRVNQYTPYGSLTFTQGKPFDAQQYLADNPDVAADPYFSTHPQEHYTQYGRAEIASGARKGLADYGGNTTDPDIWSSTVSLSPTGKQLLDMQNQISTGLGQLGQTGLGYVQNTLSKPFDWADWRGVRPMPGPVINPGQTAQQAILARLNPEIDRSRDALTTQLANQGIGADPNNPAWLAAWKAQNQKENDLTSQAALQGIGLDFQNQSAEAALRQQSIQEQNFARNEPLNMLNAVRSGAQVQNPSFVPVPQQQAVPGPNLLGAAEGNYQGQLNAYNAQQAQQGNLMSGLFGLGTSAILGGFNPFSFGGTALGAMAPAVTGAGFGLKLPQF